MNKIIPMNQKKTYNKWHLRAGAIFVVLLFIVQFGCKTEFDKYYERPKNIEGAIYSQLAADPAFAEFVKAIDKLPVFKAAVNSSGLYTCFAPVNEAVTEYLRSIGKNSFDDFNMNNLDDFLAVQGFVDAHFVLDMYFEYNFNKLIGDDMSIYDMAFDKYRYFSRLSDPNYIYFDKLTEINRKVRNDNKQTNVFMKKYLTKYNMNADYEQLYGRAPGDFNIEGSRVLVDKRDIPAVNGVIHAIDRALAPKKSFINILPTLNPYLFQMQEYNSYLSYDAAATESESFGSQLDSLFNRTANFGMDYINELSTFSWLNPPKDKLEAYINTEILPFVNGKTSLDSLHVFTRVLFFQYYLYRSTIWSSTLSRGVINAIGDTIVNPKYSSLQSASNAVIFMLEDLMVPPAFNSVARPLMLDSKFSWFYDICTLMEGAQNSRWGGFTANFDNIRYLSNPYKEYTLFVPSNQAVRNVDRYDISRELVFNKTHKTYVYRRKGRTLQPNQKDSIVNFMIIPDVALTAADVAAANNKWYETRGGMFVQIHQNQFNNIRIDSTVTAGNGVVHFFTKTDMPVKPWGTISDILYSETDKDDNSVFRNFYTILKTFNVEQEKKNIDSSFPDGDNHRMDTYLKLRDEAFTVFIPTNEALDEYRAENGLGAYNSDSKWGQVIKYLFTKTRVYSDGTFKQDETAMNPDPADPSRFISVYRKVVHADPSADDIWASFYVNTADGKMTVTSEDGETAEVIETVYNYRMMKDLEMQNGVIHVIDKVLAPPLQTIVR